MGLGTQISVSKWSGGKAALRLLADESTFSSLTPIAATTLPLHHIEEPRSAAIGGGRGRAPAALPHSRAPLCAVANCKVTPAGPTHPAAPIRRPSPRRTLYAGATALTAERGLRGDEPLRAVPRPHCRQRDRTPQRTGALAPAERQPTQKA